MRCFPPDLCTAQPVRSAKYAPLPCVVPRFPSDFHTFDRMIEFLRHWTFCVAW